MDINNLAKFEKKVYSQNGEDGVIAEILNRVGTDSRYAVEFGVENGMECNTRLLKEKGWKVLQMDGGDYKSRNIKKEFINAENINGILNKYKVPKNLDLLSIDIDSNDFWVWKAIDNNYNPRLVVIEYNATIPPSKEMAVRYDSKLVWDGGSDYFGASLLALYNLADIKNYSLVYCDKSGVNSFFVRNDLILGNFKPLSPKEAYVPYGHKMPSKSKNKMLRLKKSDYTSHKSKRSIMRIFNSSR